jgi:hypothetical protein
MIFKKWTTIYQHSENLPEILFVQRCGQLLIALERKLFISILTHIINKPT